MKQITEMNQLGQQNDLKMLLELSHSEIQHIKGGAYPDSGPYAPEACQTAHEWKECNSYGEYHSCKTMIRIVHGKC